MKVRTLNLTICGLFAALSAILSQITLPIGIVPIVLTHVSLFLAAGLLGVRYGTFSQIVYALLGAIGLPIFAGFTGGLGRILGPTGGFVIGYIVCTFVTAQMIERFGTSVKSLMLAMYAGWAVTYVIGVPWFMFVTGTDSLMGALSTCVIPFLPGDLAKTILCVWLIRRLRPIFVKMLD